MHIDFHHAVTYVLARWAGFEHPKADIIAYCSQYVDDATNEGTVNFVNGSLYKRLCSAHKMLDYRNFDELANHHVWMPFHFLPGNNMMTADQQDDQDFQTKVICRANSPIAKEMVVECIKQRDKHYGLHRLGIAMHVYADTWAHQGFSGMKSHANNLSNLKDQDNCRNLPAIVNAFFKDKIDDATSVFVEGILPLGHGAAVSFPDKPFLNWSYNDHEDKPVIRVNSEFFLEAADNMVKVMKSFIAGNLDIEGAEGLTDKQKEQLLQLFVSIDDDDADVRHNIWLDKIANGEFIGIDPITVRYAPKKQDSWKYDALGTVAEIDDPSICYPFKKEFLTSNWKLFHDALQAHRFYVIHDLLPQYGICAA